MPRLECLLQNSMLGTRLGRSHCCQVCIHPLRARAWLQGMHVRHRRLRAECVDCGYDEPGALGAQQGNVSQADCGTAFFAPSCRRWG